MSSAGMTPAYVGAPWRSRFLRAPKIALALAADPAFVSVESLATARLGLKTGKDDFFFLRRRESDAGKASNPPSLLRRRGVIAVTGMGQWSGEIAAADLQPAILNPHELFREGGRHFVIPHETQSLYLYPRQRKPRADLGTYIQLGERAEVNLGQLVTSNSTEDAWYRQVRAVVVSPWAVPYNSAYDYGAWDNSVGAVLNGRFVGVDPVDGVDVDLLGAALNSTFAIVGRLLEGIATGVEGAFDVGPPAVRRIRLPDIRRMQGQAVDEIREVLERFRREDFMPPAPSRTLVVSPVRRKLDVALLRGLGRTAGQANAIVGATYESYARWRANVEDVEQLMRQNRRQMTRAGQSRTVRPAEQIGRRVWEEMQGEVSLYPSGFLTHGDALEDISMPRGLQIPTSEPLFDAGVLHGQGARSIDLGSFGRVRYVAMLRAIGFESPLSVLHDETKARAVADRFEGERIALLTEARRRAAAYVSATDVITAAADIAERYWLRACRTAGMQPDDTSENELHVAPTLTVPVAASDTPSRRENSTR